MLLTICVTIFLFYNLDHVQKLVFKAKDTELTAELKSIRTDVYAKAEDVRMMGEEVGAIAAFGAIHTGRIVGDNHIEELVARRDTIMAMMVQFGAHDAKVDEVKAEFDKWITFDLKNELGSQLQGVLKGFDMNAEVIKNYQPGQSDKEIRTLISRATQDTSEILSSLERLNHFLKFGKLP